MISKYLEMKRKAALLKIDELQYRKLKVCGRVKNIIAKNGIGKPN